MPFVTYEQTKPWTQAIRQAVQSRQMPPWFADPAIGHFANDPSDSTSQQIQTICDWVDQGAKPGDPAMLPRLRIGQRGGEFHNRIASWRCHARSRFQPSGDVEYTYEIVPTGFTKDTWVRMSEIRPSARDHVHHAVVYVRPPSSHWLKHAPIGVPFTASTLKEPQDRRDAMWTDSEVLLVYAPGSAPDRWSADRGENIPAGSDLVFQMHYTTNGLRASDQTSIGLIFAKTPPKERVLTLQLTNDKFIIPPGVDNYRVEVHGTLPNDATLLSFFPHMHLRGKRFEYNIVHRDGTVEPLLRVNYNFYWQAKLELAHSAVSQKSRHRVTSCCLVR